MFTSGRGESPSLNKIFNLIFLNGRDRESGQACFHLLVRSPNAGFVQSQEPKPGLAHAWQDPRHLLRHMPPRVSTGRTLERYCRWARSPASHGELRPNPPRPSTVCLFSFHSSRLNFVLKTLTWSLYYSMQILFLKLLNFFIFSFALFLQKLELVNILIIKKLQVGCFPGTLLQSGFQVLMLKRFKAIF